MDDPAVAKGADPYEAIRRVAEEALESEDWPDADRNYAELNRAGALTPGDARRWVTALEHASAGHRDASTLRQLAECFPDEDDVVEFVAGELWRRAEELSEAAGPAADLTMAQLAWGSALMLAPPLARSDDDAIRMIGLLDRLYQAGRRSPNPIGTFSEFEQALLLFAAAGPQATLRAADLLSAEDPQLALDLVAGRDESAETVLVSAVASSELDDFSRAATLFDHLAIRWGIMPRDMDVEDRSRWVQAMTDVGRFEEAELACGRTIATLEGDGGSRRGVPVGVDAVGIGPRHGGGREPLRRGAVSGAGCGTRHPRPGGLPVRQSPAPPGGAACRRRRQGGPNARARSHFGHRAVDRQGARSDAGVASGGRRHRPPDVG